MTTLAAMTITVLYERKLSDGNYGSEGFSMASTVTVGQDDWRIDELLTLAKQLRNAVLSELAKSAASRVAYMAEQELNPRPATPVRTAATNDEGDLEDLPF